MRIFIDFPEGATGNDRFLAAAVVSESLGQGATVESARVEGGGVAMRVRWSSEALAPTGLARAREALRYALPIAHIVLPDMTERLRDVS